MPSGPARGNLAATNLLLRATGRLDQECSPALFRSRHHRLHCADDRFGHDRGRSRRLCLPWRGTGSRNRPRPPASLKVVAPAAKAVTRLAGLSASAARAGSSTRSGRSARTAGLELAGMAAGAGDELLGQFRRRQRAA